MTAEDKEKLRRAEILSNALDAAVDEARVAHPDLVPGDLVAACVAMLAENTYPCVDQMLDQGAGFEEAVRPVVTDIVGRLLRCYRAAAAELRESGSKAVH